MKRIATLALVVLVVCGAAVQQVVSRKEFTDLSQRVAALETETADLKGRNVMLGFEIEKLERTLVGMTFTDQLQALIFERQTDGIIYTASTNDSSRMSWFIRNRIGTEQTWTGNCNAIYHEANKDKISVRVLIGNGPMYHTVYGSINPGVDLKALRKGQKITFTGIIRDIRLPDPGKAHQATIQLMNIVLR